MMSRTCDGSRPRGFWIKSVIFFLRVQRVLNLTCGSVLVSSCQEIKKRRKGDGWINTDFLVINMALYGEMSVTPW